MKSVKEIVGLNKSFKREKQLGSNIVSNGVYVEAVLALKHRTLMVEEVKVLLTNLLAEGI